MSAAQEDLLAFFYSGFYRALVRYRALTVGGWAVAAIGGAGLLVCWRDGSDLFSIVIAIGATAGGLALVHQSVAVLDQYVRVPFPLPGPGALPGNVEAALAECARLMEEIDRGGWQEAYAALRGLSTMAARYSFPPLT